ncbi:MAG: DNA-binding protein [Pirellulaceae bacterium]|nr:MAG: DNA-binding protein [Pirellulaceae bacterium]
MAAEEPGIYLSTVEAAEALGVSVSTVKRWVDRGILPAHKTAGGHRRLLRGEVMALARRGEVPVANMAALVMGAGRRPDVISVRQALWQALVAACEAEVGNILRRCYAWGMPLETLADQVIAPVMEKVGHEWQEQRMEVWQEHRATQLCAAALYDLKEELATGFDRKAPVAIGGSPEGDPYLLASLLAQLILLDAGWQAVNLGPNTPLSSMIKAITVLRPRLVWLSVSHLEDTTEFLRAYSELYRTAESRNVAVAVGGRALTAPLRIQMPYTTHGDTLSHLAAFARVLYTRPKRPRRGRPPTS